ncbi:MAG: Electron transport complex, RnfABCDGE type, A subunit [Thermotoga sp. 50_1627]|uniref:electron transport complex subunit RsxA n=1 Tax=Pseudothermotoga sp. TaxID=2033661 RepID=UPI00076D863C|nr:MAG: Electron transport complex, RnfABCDGE type, A subunit [Thermotoga sp. 50_64]KUK24854.1 MAG: Electron transport complex, RnfABCDGE type, A subunit [Thermotoga sp. 50_1627]MBC7116916.1 electron transport complex subunit RsxA [Pseudothermotoga sp.]MDK2923771.1 H+/Na+-translocating ferredoxin:NAD+ oxidoreductase subunit [Pseudothermotoga sp.]HBT39749.1 electron transport complex subunit RsxA [Pseudothermotoga sp.]
MRVFLILFSALLINNYVFIRFLGICPFLGVSKKLDTAVGMGFAATFVLVMSSVITWFVNLLLVAAGLEFLRTVSFILVIATFVQFVEFVIKKNSPALYEALGIYLPLITTNCIILGVAILNAQAKYSLLEAIFHALGAGLGFLLALVIFAGIRERLELYELPKSFEGLPIALILASIISMAFMGFQGLIKL